MSIFTLKIAYILLTAIMLVITSFIGFYAINKTFTTLKKKRSKKMILVSGLLLWQVYIYLIANSGALNNFSFPPRFFLFLILPLFVFTGIFVYTNRKNAWLDTIPTHWLLIFQTFRVLVETIFVFTVSLGILNKEVTIEGYNFDMVYGFATLFVAILAYKKMVSKRLLIIWNYVGLLVLASVIFVFMACIFQPQLFGSETMLLPVESVTYPYVLIAGFLMPLAVFIHVLSIAQLAKK